MQFIHSLNDSGSKTNFPLLPHNEIILFCKIDTTTLSNQKHQITESLQNKLCLVKLNENDTQCWIKE